MYGKHISRVLICTLRAVKGSMDETVADVPAFADQSLIASWALDFTKFMYKYNITKGVGNNNYGPKNNCTCEQAVAFLVRAYDLLPTLQ